MVHFPLIFLEELLGLLRCDLTMFSKFYSFYGIYIATHLYDLSHLKVIITYSNSFVYFMALISANTL